MEIIRAWNINLTVEEVLQVQGCNPIIIGDAKSRIFRTAERAIEEGSNLLEPKVIQCTFHISQHTHQGVELVGRNEALQDCLSGPLITKLLARAEKVSVIMCTIGSSLEQKAAMMMKSDPLYGWALDCLGSLAINSLAIQAFNQLENSLITSGLKCTIPLSPGMDGWPVEQGQTEIFNLIDPSTIGISLSAKYQMQPCKSLSMIIGMGHTVKKNGTKCDYCFMNTICNFQNSYIEHNTDN